MTVRRQYGCQLQSLRLYIIAQHGLFGPAAACGVDEPGMACVIRDDVGISLEESEGEGLYFQHS